MENLLKLTIGTVGVGATQVVQTVTPGQVNDVVGLLGQIVIIIATLISLFKKKPQPVEINFETKEEVKPKIKKNGTIQKT